MNNQTGTLFIVPTPIGNLADITQRAIDTLIMVDVIAAEDTRHSARLLQHLTVKTPMLSLHDHNEKARAKQLITRLNEGQNVALISDAGTPLISDPGYGLVTACREANINVSALPGACAAITALSASGLPTDRFTFAGFLPVKQLAKTQILESLKDITITNVFYESPRRILDTVAMIASVLGNRREVVIARELTKTFEQYFSGDAEAALAWLERDTNHQRGEFVLMIKGAEVSANDIPAVAIELLETLTKELPLKKAAAIVASHYSLKKNDLYQLGLERKQQ